MDKRRVWKWSVVGIAFVVFLAMISISRYQRVILKSREEVLGQNLAAVRSTLKQYTEDKHSAPQSLQDLVKAGYFRELPSDPITQSKTAWKPVKGSVVISQGKTVQGITDLHSGSNSISSNGTLYSSW